MSKNNPLSRNQDIPVRDRVGYLLNREYVNSIKSRTGCMGSGPHAGKLTFHHKDPTKKVATIAYLVRAGISREALDRELKKCRVLCEACHKSVHSLDTKTN